MPIPRKQAVRTAFGYTNLYDFCGNMIVRHGGLTNSQAMVYDADNRLEDIFAGRESGRRIWLRGGWRAVVEADRPKPDQRPSLDWEQL